MFPDNRIDIPIAMQNIVAYVVALLMSLYFIFYIYKVLDLSKMRFYAFQGSLIFIVLPFIFVSASICTYWRLGNVKETGSGNSFYICYCYVIFFSKII